MARLRVPKRSDLRLTQILAILAAAAAVAGWALYATSPRSAMGASETAGLEAGNATCVAVMFWSPTCPVCERMLPYWRTLEPGNDSVRIVDIEYTSESSRLFNAYRVWETPTFIVLDRGGAELARHVGAFQGPDPSLSMREWVASACSGTAGHAPGEGGVLASLASRAWPLAMVAAGVGIALSPCVAPLVLAVGTLGRGVPTLRCAAASTAALFLVAASVSVAVSLVAGLVSWVRYAAAIFAVMAGGYMAVLGEALPPVRAGSASCLGLGLLAAQCSLPLVAGVIALAGTLSLGDALTASALVALGAGAGLAVLYRAGGLLSRLASKYQSGQRIAGVALALAGVAVLWGW